MRKIEGNSFIEDFHFLLKTLKSVHPGFETFTHQSVIQNKIKEIEQRLPTCETPIDFYKMVAPLIASFKDGHTSCFPANDYAKLIAAQKTLFPFYLNFQEKRAFVTKIYQQTPIQIGAEITAINDTPIKNIIENLLPLISAETEKIQLTFLQNYFRPLLSLIYEMTDHFQVTYQQGKETKKIAINGVSHETITKTHQLESPNFFHFEINGEIAIIKITNFYNYDEFKHFAKNAFTQIKNDKITKLIIDVRDNSGGDSRIGEELLKYVSAHPFRQYSAINIKVSEEIKQYYRTNEHIRNYYETTAPHILEDVEKSTVGETITYEMEYVAAYNALHFSGKVNVLTNARTYSSATNFVAAIKDYKLGMIIGDTPGGYATHYGDIYMFHLPKSHLQIIVSHKEHIRPSGCEKHEEITPDVVIMSEPFAKEDRVLEYSKALFE